MNKKQYNALKKYEKQLQTARFGYVTGVSHTMIDLFCDIYEEVTGKKLHRHYSCNACVLKICKLTSDIFYNYLSEQNEKEH